MMDFKERLDLYLEGGMLNQNDVDDVNAIVKVFSETYGVTLTEEDAGSFIAHICAAYARNVSNEEIDPLPEVAKEELEGLETYPESLEVLDKILEVTKNPLSQTERDYSLLHINNLIRQLMDEKQWRVK